jgi:hypothetical protein
MDAKLFRLPTKPNYYAAIATANPFEVDAKGKAAQAPASDPRFPGWAGQMSDGRLVTDYRNHCSRNVPAGRQFATKEWMTKNAEELIRVSRQRQAEQAGAVFKFDSSVVPPPEQVVECTPSDCTRTVTQAPGGIGTERAGAPCPFLFGTWDAAEGGTAPPAANVQGTRRYEGGRNTPRGGSL